MPGMQLNNRDFFSILQQKVRDRKMFEAVSSSVDFSAMEKEVLQFWQEQEVFRKSVDNRAGGKEYVFYDGPPFATGLPHYGHLLAGTIKDVVPRYRTMRGDRVQRTFGWDCHGLPVENEMEKIKGEIPADLTDKAAEALFCTSKDVPVLLDESCDMEKVIAEKDYGLFYDSPENEHHKWNADYNISQKALNYIAKQRARAVKKSVGQMQSSCDIVDVNISRLTPLQIEDIKDYTNSAEDIMIASIPPDLADVSAYTQRLEKESEEVKKVINRRMTKKTVGILSAICIALYIICFLPFLFANNNTPQTVATAVGITGVAIIALAIILFVSLFFLRSSVLNAVRNYNNVAREVLGDIHSALEQFSKYLSASYNVRRGHAVQNYAQKNLDEYTKSLRVRKKHQEDIRKKRALLLEGYADYFGDRSFCDETMSRPYDYDFDVAKEYSYPAPFLAGDERQIEFISNGNLVTVPSSYITKITVRMEGIYET